MKKLSVFLCAMVFVFGVVGIANSAFIDHGDGTVTDTDTGLMWAQVTKQYAIWFEAVDWCEIWSYDGYTDWYLPSVDELLTIVDTNYYPTVDPEFFPNTLPVGYWTSTTLESNAGFAWFVQFMNGTANGGTEDGGKPTVRSARAVRLSEYIVPIPGIVWLLGSGLIVFAGYRKKIRKGDAQ